MTLRLMSRRWPALFAAPALLVSFLVLLSARADAVGPSPVLAYGKVVGGLTSIYTADLDGTHAALRVKGGGQPVVSPDGSKLAYLRFDPVHRISQLYVASITGAGAVHLLDSVVFSGMSWSPDGVRLVVSRYPSALVVVNVAARSVTPIPGTAGETSPQWSPDGTLIAARLGQQDQVLHRPDGSSRVVRARTVTGPWSADGESMLQVDPSSNCLCSVNVLSGARRQLAFLRESYVYIGAAWGRPSINTISAYLSIDSVIPGEPGGSTSLYRFDSDNGAPDTSQMTLVAGNAIFPSTGGISASDLNGPPGAVDSLTSTISPSYVELSWEAPAATPDFAGVEIRYALGGTPPASVTDGLDGGRLLTSDRRLGPFPPDQAVAISVFSRDWSGKIGPASTTVVTTPHQAAVTLAAHASPFDMYYRHQSTITVTMTRDYDRAPVTNAPVPISRRRWSTNEPFTALGSGRTNSLGQFTFLQIPSVSYDYRLSYAGSADETPAAALTRIRISRQTKIMVDHASAIAGSAIHLSVATDPALVNGLTYLQRFTTRFVNVGPHNTNRAGSVLYTVTAPPRGKSVQYRVRVPGRDSYIDSYSKTVTLTGR